MISPERLSALNDKSSIRRSIIVCKRLAPIFSVLSLTCHAALAKAWMPSSLNETSTPSVANKAMYCSVNDAFGSVKILTKSLVVNACNSTRIGNLPYNSGIKSEGFAI